MKKKNYRITLKDFMLANRKASREEEIAAHGRQISMRTLVHKSRKKYSRPLQGRHAVPDE